MNRLQWTGLGIVALTLALLISAPARLLLPLLPEQRVLVDGLSGSLWRGAASAVKVRTDAGYFHLGKVTWQLSPASLLTLAPGIHLDSQWGQQRVQGYIRISGSDSIEVAGVEARFPASLAQQFAPVAIAGSIQLQIEMLAIDGGLPVRAIGRVVWEEAVFASRAGPQPLGTYVLLLNSPEQGRIEGEVQTLAGPLQAEGQASLRGRAYDIDVKLRNEGPLYPAIEESLMLFAVPRGDTWQVTLAAEI